ncbi:MAG TPA: hypothetical protein VN829_03005 [Dongiaceae bacterium]|nr:hypothetical protein [Dongiaceae bacterium]
MKTGSPEVPRTVLGRAQLVLRMVPKALGLVWAAAPGLATANVILTTFQGVLPAVTIWFAKAIIDGVVTAARTGTRADTAQVLLLVALWFGVQLLTTLTGAILQFVGSLQSDLLSNHIAVRTIEKAATLDLSYFEDPPFYDKLENVRNQASFRPIQLATQLFGLLRRASRWCRLLACWWRFPGGSSCW